MTMYWRLGASLLVSLAVMYLLAFSQTIEPGEVAHLVSRAAPAVWQDRRRSLEFSVGSGCLSCHLNGGHNRTESQP